MTGEPSTAKRGGRRRWLRRLLWVALLGFVATNVVACWHARAMTHFVDAATRTPAPEDLDWLGKAKVLFTGVCVPRPENERTPAALGLAFDTDTLTVPDAHRIEQWIVERPGARLRRGVIVAFPGYAASKSTLLPYVPTFHALGFDCVLVDPRGVGGSTGSTTTIGHDEAIDVAAAFRAAKARYPETPIVLFGYSGGAAAITRAVATEGLDPDAVILESCFDTLLETVRNRFRSMGLPSFPLAHLLVFWGGALHGFNGFAHDPAGYAASIRAPTLLLNGADDPRVPPASARTLHRAFGGSAALEIFEGIGHASAIGPRPSEWRTRVRTFLDRVVPPRGRSEANSAGKEAR